MTTRRERIELDGRIVEAFPNGMFTVRLESGQNALGYAAGALRRYRARILPGDRIKLELPAYDQSRGRIVYRYR